MHITARVASDRCTRAQCALARVHTHTCKACQRSRTRAMRVGVCAGAMRMGKSIQCESASAGRIGEHSRTQNRDLARCAQSIVARSLHVGTCARTQGSSVCAGARTQCVSMRTNVHACAIHMDRQQRNTRGWTARASCESTHTRNVHECCA
eukprot:1825020-Pleurochrysis_carterae.AAC.3